MYKIDCFKCSDIQNRLVTKQCTTSV